MDELYAEDHEMQELYAEDNEMQENDDEMSLSCVTINSSRSSSCGSEEELVDTQTAELLIDTTSILIAMIATDISFNSITALPGRIGNQHRNREQALTECRSWDDAMFKRQFRLSRRAYNNLIQIIYPALQVNITRAISSSGSSISPELMVLITLRMLAGASYLDMIWFRVCIDHVTKYVLKVCNVIIPFN